METMIQVLAAAFVRFQDLSGPNEDFESLVIINAQALAMLAIVE